MKIKAKIKTTIYVSFRYCGWNLNFRKTIMLPFVPFYGLVLFDNSVDHENRIPLDNDDYTRTSIYHIIDKNRINIDWERIWKRPVSDETIDGVVSGFGATCWTRTDNTNLDELKALMKSEASKRN